MISSYLTDRQQRVKIGNVFSSTLPVTSGAPQGSLLGPFLFVLYCHDVKPANDCTSLFIYADDICEVCPIFKDDYALSVQNVAIEFENIYSWSVSNSLRLNSDKTRALCIRKKNFDVIFPFPFSIVESCKLLGVIWNERLTWTSHFLYLLKCVSKRLYIIRILKQVLPHDDLWHVFHMVIASLLLYSTQLFGPLDYENKRVVKSIFKRAARLICSVNCTCEIVVFRSLYLKSQIPQHSLYSLVPHPKRNRLQVPFCTTNRRQDCFTVFCTLLMNGLTIDSL